MLNEMASRWIPKITDPEEELIYSFNCVGCSTEQLNIIRRMDNNNEWNPPNKVKKWLNKQVGALPQDWSVSYKYCVWKGTQFVCAYFSAIHYVFQVVPKGQQGQQGQQDRQVQKNNRFDFSSWLSNND